MKKFTLTISLIGILLPVSGWGETLTLLDYLHQVQTRGPDYLSFKASAEGLKGQAHQLDLTYSPILTAGYNHLDDNESPENIQAMPHTLSDSAGASITTKFPFGPSLTLGYSFVNTNMEFNELYSALGNSLNLPDSYYQTAPTLSLSIPLLKDFGGSQTRAEVHKSQYQFESSSETEFFQMEQALYKAKVAYWNLTLARVEVAIWQDTLERNRKIWNWTQKRLARQLADETDDLQAEMAVRRAELNLRKAQEDERSARFEFNKYRNVESGDVPEILETLENSLVQIEVDIPDDPPERLDLKAEEMRAEQQKAVYDYAKQDIYPDLTLKASWCGNGYDPDFGSANQTSFRNNYPSYSIGAQFSLSLDVFTASQVAEGYWRCYESSFLTLKNKQIEVAQQWADLKEKLLDVDEQLAMSTRIEKLQKRNAEEQKEELAQGRTTQYQLLSCENDYSLSRLDRIRLIQEKLTLLAEAQWWLSGVDPNGKGDAK